MRLEAHCSIFAVAGEEGNFRSSPKKSQLGDGDPGVVTIFWSVLCV